MEVRRIGPDGGFLREFTDVRRRVQHLETRPSGVIATREMFIVTDPETGVQTIMGKLPDGSIGFQPFVGDIVPPPVATQPVVSAQPGIFTVSWDGLFVGNADKPTDFQHVNVIGHLMDGTTTLSSLTVGVLRLATDTVFVAQDIAGIGDSWQFSLESEDYNGNLAVRGARSLSLVMLSTATDAGVNAALEALQEAAEAASGAAQDARDAADAAQDAADQLALDLTATDAAVAAAQLLAEQAFNDAFTASEAAGDAQETADGKGTSWYLDDQPAGTSHKIGDLWFDKNDSYKLHTWDGTVWQTTQDSALAQITAESKGRTYTQNTTPPVEARLPQNLWNDTSLGEDKVVVKYWSTVAGAWTALADKEATEARVVADSKGETIYSSTAPTVAQRLPQNLWVDTTGGINIHKRWDGSGWVVVADLRIAETVAAVVVAQDRADSAFDDAEDAQFAADNAQDAADLAKLNADKALQSSVKTYRRSGKDTVGIVTASALTPSTMVSVASDGAPGGFALQKTGTSNNNVYDMSGIQDFNPDLLYRVSFKLRVVTDSTVLPKVLYAGVLGLQANGTSGVTTTGTSSWSSAHYFAANNVTLAVADGWKTYTGYFKGWNTTGNGGQHADPLVPGTVHSNVRKFVPMAFLDYSGGNGTWEIGSIEVDIVSPEGVQAIIDAAAAQTVADQAFADADSAAEAAGTAQLTADAKNRNWYQTTAPAGTGHKDGDQWFDTDDLNKLYLWKGTPTLAWVSFQDGAISAAQGTANSALSSANGKNRNYYQTAMPTGGTYILGDTWFDTDDGFKVYVHNGTTFIASQDTAIATAQGAANSKTKTFIQGTAPTATTTGDIWIDTANGNVIKTWEGSSWVNRADTAIATAQSAATSALSSANGKNRNYYQTTQPSGGTYIAGDTWFDTDDGNQIYVHNGTTWVVTDFGASAIADLAITNAKIADATIQSAKIGSVDAGTITVGTLNAARIASGSIVAEKMTIGAGPNMLLDPALQDADLNTTRLGLSNAGTTFGVWSIVSGEAILTWTSGTHSSGTEVFYLRQATSGSTATHIPVTPGTSYRLTMEAFRATGTTPAVRYAIYYKKVDGTFIYVGDSSGSNTSLSVDGWQTVTREWIAPADAIGAGFDLQISLSGNGNGLKFRNPTVSQKVTGSLIVDGAIQAGSAIIADGAIGTAKIGDAQITNAKIVDATIQSAKIGSVDAGTITVGTLSAARIAAKSIATDKLLIGSTDNIISEPDFTGAGLAWGSMTGAFSIDPTGARNSGPAFKIVNAASQQGKYNTPWVPIEGDQSYRLTAWVKSDVEIPLNGVSLYITTKNAAGTTSAAVALGGNSAVTAADTWVRITGTRKLPADAILVEFGIFSQIAFSTGNLWVDFVSANRMATGALIVDGAITAGSAIIGTGAIGTAQIGDAQITTAKIGDVQITNAKIVDATIQSAKIGSVDAGTITVGTLNAARIGANSISASKLLVSDFSNFLENPYFETGDLTGWTITGGWTVNNTAPASGVYKALAQYSGSTQYLINNAKIYLKAGEKVRVKLFTYADAPTSGTQISISLYNTVGAGLEGTVTPVVTSNPFVESEYVITAATTGIKQLRIATAGTGSGYLRVDNIRMYKMSAGELIVDGAILTQHMTSGTIDAGVLTAGSITAPKIAAKSITADKLLITSTDNLIQEADFSGNGSSWQLASDAAPAPGFAINATAGRNSLTAMVITNSSSLQTSFNAVGAPTKVPIEYTSGTGNSYRVSAWLKATVSVPVSGAYISARFRSDTGSYTTISMPYTTPGTQTPVTMPTAGTWYEISGMITAPANTISVAFSINSAAALSTGTLTWDIVSATRASGGSLIVDGAIDGKTITGALIQTIVTANTGIKLTSTELAGWSDPSTKTFSLTSAGVLTLKGAIQSGSTITGAAIVGGSVETSATALSGVKMTSTGIKAYDAGNSLTFHLDATTGLLEVPGLKANSVSGDRIVSGSLTTEQVRIGDFANHVTNGFGELGTGKGLGSGFIYETTDKPTLLTGVFKTTAGQGTTSALATMFDVTPNTEYITEVWLKASLPNSRIYIELRDQAAAQGTAGILVAIDNTPVSTSQGSYALSNYIVPTTWTKYTIKSTTTATATRLRVGSLYFNHTNGSEQNAVISFAIGVRRRLAGSLIVDGAILTQHMTSGTIDAGVLTAGSITAPKIASKSITVDKLVVTSTDNLVVEANFSNSGSSWEIAPAKPFITINATAGRGSLPAFRVTGTVAAQTSLNLVNKVSVGAEDRFRGSIWVKSTAALAAGKVLLKAKAYTTATAFTNITIASSPLLVIGAWTNVPGISAALPSGTIALEFFLDITNNATGTITDIDYVAVTRAADGNLIVDGAMDAKSITGAIIKTAASGARVVLDTTGIYGYDSLGVNYLSGTAAGLSLTGLFKAHGVTDDNVNPEPMTVITGNLEMPDSPWDPIGVHFVRDGWALGTYVYTPPRMFSFDGTDLQLESATIDIVNQNPVTYASINLQQGGHAQLHGSDNAFITAGNFVQIQTAAEGPGFVRLSSQDVYLGRANGTSKVYIKELEAFPARYFQSIIVASYPPNNTLWGPGTFTRHSVSIGDTFVSFPTNDQILIAEAGVYVFEFAFWVKYIGGGYPRALFQKSLGGGSWETLMAGQRLADSQVWEYGMNRTTHVAANTTFRLNFIQGSGATQQWDTQLMITKIA